MSKCTAVFGVSMPVSAVMAMFIKKYGRMTALGYTKMPGETMKIYKLTIAMGGYTPSTEEP